MIRMFLCALLLVTSAAGSLQARQKKINVTQQDRILHSKIIPIIDGIGIQAYHIHSQLIIRAQVVQMLYGASTSGAGREGLYTFNDKKYTVEQLNKLEAQNSINDNALFLIVKQDFVKRISPFLELARSFKAQISDLIAESLRLHKKNHRHSILLKWAHSSSSDDMEAFNTHVNSFRDLSEFLYDLLNFLDDLISSCPKAQQQFLDGLKTEKEKLTYKDQFKRLFDQQKSKTSKTSPY